MSLNSSKEKTTGQSNSLINQADAEKEIASTKDIEENIPEEVQEIIERLPEQEGDMVKSMVLSMSGRIQETTHPAASIAKKVTPSHISSFLTYSDKSDERKYKYSLKTKLYTFLYVMLGIGVFIFVTVFLAKEFPDLYTDILKIAFGFLGGLGIGIFIKVKK